MTYADYTYYAGTYMGTVGEEEFPRLAVRASSFLDYYTQGRAKDNAELDAVKMFTGRGAVGGGKKPCQCGRAGNEE